MDLERETEGISLKWSGRKKEREPYIQTGTKRHGERDNCSDIDKESHRDIKTNTENQRGNLELKPFGQNKASVFEVLTFFDFK